MGFVDLADELDIGIEAEQRGNLRFPITLVHIVDLRGDLERFARARGDADRAVRALFRRDAAKEGEIAILASDLGRQQVGGQAVINCACPIHRGHRQPLVIGNGNQAVVGKGLVERDQVRKVEPPVQGRDAPPDNVLEERHVDEVDMEMERVELICALSHCLKQHYMIGYGVAHIGV